MHRLSQTIAATALMLATGVATQALAAGASQARPSYDAMLRAQATTADIQQQASLLISQVHDDFHNADAERAYHAAEHVAVFGKRLVQNIIDLRLAYDDPHFAARKIDTCRQAADLTVAIRDGFSAAARAGDGRLQPAAFANIGRRLAALSRGLLCGRN